MKVKATKGILCPACDSFILKEEMPEETSLFQCGECEEVYQSKGEAENCCKE